MTSKGTYAVSDISLSPRRSRYKRARPLKQSHHPVDEHLLDLADGLGGVETLGADLGAVHDRVAAIELEGVFQVVEALARRLVAAVGQPPPRREQGRWARYLSPFHQ